MLEKEEDGKKRIYLEPSSFYLPAKGTFLCAGQFLMAINLKGTGPFSPVRCWWFFSVSPPVEPVIPAGSFYLQAREKGRRRTRSEEHTSELQSRENLVCRLLLEKKNK